MKPVASLLILGYCCSLVCVYPSLAIDANACKLDIDLPQSVLYDLTIVLTLPRGLIYDYATPSDITSETISSPNDGSRDEVITWKFDRIDNTDDGDLSIHFRIIAANTADNRDGFVPGPIRADLAGKDSRGRRITGQSLSAAVRIVEPDLEITKSASPTSARAGEDVTYTISIFHSPNSHADAYDVEILDELPPNMAYSPGSFKVISGPSPIFEAGQTQRIHFAKLGRYWSADNRVWLSFRAKIRDSARAGDTIKNEATVTWASAPADYPQRRTGSGGLNWYRKSATSSIRIAGLCLVKECSPNPVNAGSRLTYDIKYINYDANLHGVVIKETYDRNLVKFESSDPPPDPGTDDQWTLGDLMGGSKGEIAVHVQVNSSAQGGTMLKNLANISSNEHINASAENNATINAKSLTIIKEASKTLISQGSPDLKYTITLKNNDAKKATNVSVTDILDANLNYILSNPLPDQILDRKYRWDFSDLEPGDERAIEITARLKPRAELTDSRLDRVYNLYRVESDQSAGGFKELETEIMHSLFIVKKAEKRSYAFGELINYTISYGNSQNQSAKNVKIFDKLPDVEFLSAEPSPSFVEGNLLEWDIGELLAGSNRSISLTVRLKKRPEMDFQESGSVSGVGYVHTRSRLSTNTQPHFLTNYVNITGSYVTGPDNEVLDNDSSYDSVAISDSIGTEVEIDEHGSGYYQNEQNISLNNSRRCIILDKKIDAKHAAANLRLCRGRNLSINSPWNEQTYAKNRVRDESLSKTHLYADAINENLHLQADENQTVYQSTDESNGSMTGLTYQSGKMNVNEIQEDYEGSFKTTESLTSYGSDRIYEKHSTGVGFVSSDNRMQGNQRSYEHGSGSYNSSEVMGRGTVYKMLDVAQYSTDLTWAGRKVHFADKWNEGMSTKDLKFNSSISERISQADRIKKEAIMGRSSLSTAGNLSGMAETRFKIQNGAKQPEELLMEQFFSGTFSLNYVVGVQFGPKYLYPHLNLTKTALKQDADTVLFRINLTNDGNKTLGPVEVMDILPAGMTFVNSSLIPSVVGQNVSWTLLMLPIGRMQTIDLRARLRDTSYPYQNHVIAVGRYGAQLVTAHASVIVILDWLPCCLQQIHPVKTQIQDSESLSFFSGEWKLPGCMGLNGTGFDCEQYIDEYYNSSESECHDCLFDASLPEVVYLESL
jgi:uncharacterized repeat protein (TIGR01451 family)/fimbrial isopeptide formation D2 family protein